MLWLDKWREELDIQCPYSSPSISPIVKSNFYKNQTRKLDKIVFDGKSKSYSRLVLGCDNQTSELHAFTMLIIFMELAEEFLIQHIFIIMVMVIGI